MSFRCLLVFCSLLPALLNPVGAANEAGAMTVWTPLADLPFKDGLAGPYVGISGGMLIVAGGANFPLKPGDDLWHAKKVWHTNAYVLRLADGPSAAWKTGLSLKRPGGYGAVVTTKSGIVCLGGNDATTTFADCFLLSWDSAESRLAQVSLPALPRPLANGAAALIGDTVYLVGGQTGEGLETATNTLYALDLSKMKAGGADFSWRELPPMPSLGRAFNLTLAQHNGSEDCLYVMSGRRQLPNGQTEALQDVWEYSPSKKAWRERHPSPLALMAGTGAPFGPSHLLILSGADEANMNKVDELKDAHPGFPHQAWAYNTITDTWAPAGKIPANQVTTTAVSHQGSIYIASGEIRPRVRTDKVWQIKPVQATKQP
jgi:N-acetylneuraminic acid mutarotase